MERPSRHKRIGLVLSGGGARGFAHIGVLRALERAGAKFDVVAGTSMGAILGAMYANGRSADEIFEIAMSTSWRDVVDISLQAGLIKGDKFEAFLALHLPRSFDDLDLPFAVTTTDIESGEDVLIAEGDLVKAVRASSSFPGAIEPIQFMGRTLADGGIVNNLPVAAATVLGANRVVASDVTAARHSVYRTPDEEGNWWERMVATVKLERRNPMVQMLLRSSDIQQSILVDIHASLHPPDLRIRMAMPQFRVESFKDIEEIVAIGEKTAEATLAARGGWQALLAAEGPDYLDAEKDAIEEAVGEEASEALQETATKRGRTATTLGDNGRTTARQLMSAVAKVAGKRAGAPKPKAKPKPGRPSS